MVVSFFSGTCSDPTPEHGSIASGPAPTDGRYPHLTSITLQCDDGFTYSNINPSHLCIRGFWNIHLGTCIPNDRGESFKIEFNFLFPKCFSLNSANSVTKICYYSKKIRTWHTSQLSCKWPGCYQSARKTHVRDNIFKFSPVYASVIYWFL